MDIIFLFIFFSFPVFVYTFLKYTSKGLLTLGMDSFLLLSIFAFAYIGIFILYFGLDIYQISENNINKIVYFKALIFTIITIIFLVLGNFMSKNIFSVSIQKITKSINKESRSELIAYVFFIFLILAVLFLYISKISTIALVLALSGSGENLGLARSEMGNNFGGGYHWFSFITRGVSTLVLFSLYASWLKFRRKITGILFILLLIISILSSMLLLEKGPLVWLLIGLFITQTIVKSDGILPMRKLIIIGIIMISGLAVFNVILLDFRDYKSAIQAISSRIFTGAISPSYYYLIIFPDYIPFLNGASFPNPSNLLPFEHFRLTVEVMSWRYPELAAQGITGSSPTIFWAEAYANFGSIGVILVPLVIGFLLNLVNVLFLIIPNKPIRIGFITWSIIHYSKLAEGGFSGYLFDMEFMVVLFATLIISYFKKIF